MQNAHGASPPTKVAEYNAVVIDHFSRPRNAAPGLIDHALCGAGGSVDSGVWIEFQLQIEQSHIQQAYFRAYGCPHTLALASWLTERLVGEKLSTDYALDHAEISAMLNLPTEKMRSALVAEDALRACAADLTA